jgi:hypothetical protein
MQCSNKEKQLALAIHNYHDVHGEFPMNGDSWGPVNDPANPTNLNSMQHVSIWVFTLPFMEQTSLYDQWMTVYRSGTYVAAASGTPTAASGRHGFGNVYDYPQDLLASDVQFVACPSDSEGGKLHYDTISSKNHRAGNYVASAGDWVLKPEYSGSANVAKGATGWTRGAIRATGLGTPISAITEGQVIPLS